MTLYKWSTTAATNGTADSTCQFPEGMAPSAINDGTRGMMAAVAKHRDDISGQIATGGTSTAYTVSSFQGFVDLPSMHLKEVWFTPHTTNGATVTLNVDGLGAKPLRSAPGVELQSGVMIQGTPVGALYNNTDGAWYLKGNFNSYGIPLFGGLDYWDTVTPGSAFIFPAGQAISRTTYAAAFARWGTTYGAGDGSTTFNAPDKTGRVSAMKEAAASRLTSSWFGGNSANLGAVGFNERNALSSTNQLPQFTPSGTVTLADTGASNWLSFNHSGTLNWGPSSGSHALGDATALSASFSGNAIGSASPASFATGQPTIICNYIIRIL